MLIKKKKAVASQRLTGISRRKVRYKREPHLGATIGIADIEHLACQVTSTDRQSTGVTADSYIAVNRTRRWASSRTQVLSSAYRISLTGDGS